MQALSANAEVAPDALVSLSERAAAVADEVPEGRRGEFLDTMARWERAVEDRLLELGQQIRQAQATNRATIKYQPLRAAHSDQYVSRKV